MTAEICERVVDLDRKARFAPLGGGSARRFLEQDATVILSSIHELFAGHLRAIVGGMSVEDMQHNREELTANIRASLAEDLQKLGMPRTTRPSWLRQRAR